MCWRKKTCWDCPSFVLGIGTDTWGGRGSIPTPSRPCLARDPSCKGWARSLLLTPGKTKGILSTRTHCPWDGQLGVMNSTQAWQSPAPNALLASRLCSSGSGASVKIDHQRTPTLATSVMISLGPEDAGSHVNWPLTSSTIRPMSLRFDASAFASELGYDRGVGQGFVQYSEAPSRCLTNGSHTLL